MQVADYYLGRQTVPPLADGHADIVLDVTLTSQAAAEAAGFTVTGTGAVFDASGFNGKGTSYLSIGNWADQAEVYAKGTLYLRVERQALSFPNSYALPTTFSDSSGTVSANVRYLISVYNDTSTYTKNIYVNASTNGAVICRDRTNSTNVLVTFPRLNSHYVETYQDETYCDVVWTWSGRTFYIYIDGHLLYTGTSSADPVAEQWDNIRLGWDGASQYLGDHYIQRIQISKAFCPPVLSGPRIGMIGDSFCQGGDTRANPTGWNVNSASDTATVATIDAVQNGIKLTTRYGEYDQVFGQCYWMLMLQALCWENLGFYPSYYNAGDSGAGWAEDRNPIPDAYFDALNAFRPEVVIAFGTVNDVNAASPAASIVADTKAKLDVLIDENPAIRKILYIESFTGHQSTAAAYADGTWLTEFKRLQALTRAGLDGYRDVVKYVRTYEAWGGDNYPTEQTIGSNTDNTAANGPAGTSDIHPCATGYAKIAEIIWPHLRDALLERPQR